MVTLAPREVVPPICSVERLVSALLISALLVIVNPLSPPLRLLPMVRVLPAFKVVLAVNVRALPKFISPVVMMLAPDSVMPAEPDAAEVVRLAKLAMPPIAPPSVTAPVLVVVIVKLWAPLMVLLSISAPTFLIVVLPARVMAPLAVAEEALLLYRAPLELSPVPVKLKALATVKPLRSSAVPELIVTTPVPKGPSVTDPVELIPAFKVPALTVVPPL